MMRKSIGLRSIAALAATVAGTAVAQERAQVGQLTCDISGGIGFIFGSQKRSIAPSYAIVPAPVEFYAGALSKLGIDLGGTTAA